MERIQIQSVYCSICYCKYNKTNHLPRVLACGHTFCQICINRTIQGDRKCGTCRINYQSVLLNTYPINQILLQAKDRFTRNMNKLKKDIIQLDKKKNGCVKTIQNIRAKVRQLRRLKIQAEQARQQRERPPILYLRNTVGNLGLIRPTQKINRFQGVRVVNRRKQRQVQVQRHTERVQTQVPPPQRRISKRLQEKRTRNE